MPSPFPGMDPYLEISGDWRDFHATFVNTCCDVLNERIPAHYVARVDERFRLAGMTIRPSTTPVEEVRETFIEIRRVPDRSPVTAIELRSPTNKLEPDFSGDAARRASLIGRRVHIVELDLLAGGHCLPTKVPLPPCDYYALVSRAERRPECELYSWTIRQPLPSFRIPLAQPDPNVILDLGEIFAATYRRRHYERSIDYAAPLTLPLPPGERAWAEAVARREPT